MYRGVAKRSVALMCLLLGFAPSMSAAQDDPYRVVAMTVCADFAGLKILQDPDLLALYLAKQLRATKESAEKVSKGIISDLNGANYYCFSLEEQMNYTKGTLVAAP